jgi:hypothetical protein
MPPAYVLVLAVKIVLSALFGLNVALTAIHGSTFAWFEWYFSFLTTLGAYGREHLALWSVTIATRSVTLCLPGFTACGTTLGLISIAFSLEELLLLSTESESSPAIGTLDCFVLEAHWITSSLLLIGQSFGYPTPGII